MILLLLDKYFLSIFFLFDVRLFLSEHPYRKIIFKYPHHHIPIIAFISMPTS